MRQTVIAVVVLFNAICGEALASELTGIPLISDGDTISIAGTKIRLEGIDAPETDQLCLNPDGAKWTCGIEARNRLSARVSGHQIKCRLDGVDRYGRSLGVCYVDGVDLNAWMVREGWALAYVHYSRTYVTAESEAHANPRGLWRGAFIAPWDWRHRGPKTIVLGALSVPVTAQADLLAPASSVGAPSSECTIKGNVNRNGERIFHMPGQVAYARVNMTGQGKRWFCTPNEAIAAGWRAALR
jgi:endonuclease YncB( thermonuclease family)